MRSIPDWVSDNYEWAAAVHLLTSPLVERRAMQHVHFDRDYIDFDALHGMSWSSGEALLIAAAQDMYNGYGQACLGALIRTLGGTRHLDRVLEAVRVRVGELSLDEVAGVPA